MTTTEPSVALGAPKRSAAYRVLSRLGGFGVQALLILVALFWLTPSFGLFIASLRSSQETQASGWWTVWTKPAELSFSNYAARLSDPDILGALWNTALISVPATLLVVLLSAGAAYAFAWMEFPGRDWLFLVVVALIVVPIQVGLIPDAGIFGALGIFGTVSAAVLFHVAFGLPFAIFLLRNFFIGIPKDLLEAARMDGGKEFTIFRKVVLPLGWPAIASLAIFQFLWVWNDLLVAQVFAGQAKPITVALREQTRSFGANIDIIAPGVFLSMVVPLIVFFAFQRYFVQGVLAGSVK
ncbi:MAG: carbohydrate ABC transporter permease [Micromonosporaceae bacterium]